MRAGVPDPHKRLGKRTFLHPTTLVLGDFEQRVDGYYGAPQSLYSDQFTWRDGVDGAIGYKMEVMPTHPGLMTSLIGGYGSLARTQAERLPHYAAAIAMMRDGFHDESEGGAVELSKYGDAVLDYVLNDYVLEGLRHSHLMMSEMLFAAGAQSVRAGHGDMPFMSSWKQVKELIPTLKYAPGMAGCGSAHVMGGCTMGADETRCLTDSEGRYRARSIVPCGYGCAPDGPTQECLDLLGRHGQRPAHIHFFISAPGHRHLTTQINLAGEQYLWDDFAYATRDGLVGDIKFVEDAAAARDRGLQGSRFAELQFDFQLQKAPAAQAEQRSKRPRALQGA